MQWWQFHFHLNIKILAVRRNNCECGGENALQATDWSADAVEHRECKVTNKMNIFIKVPHPLIILSEWILATECNVCYDALWEFLKL